VPKSGSTNYSTPEEDGYSKIGVAWPVPRFTTNDTGAATNVVIDNLTGLMWARNANLASNTVWSVNGTCTWATAVNVITNSAGPVNGANYGGYDDWRLPNAKEQHSLVHLGFSTPALSDATGTNHWTTDSGPFIGVRWGTLVQTDYYWTSTTHAISLTRAWSVDMGLGLMYYRSHSAYTKSCAFYVWPVRGP